MSSFTRFKKMEAEACQLVTLPLQALSQETLPRHVYGCLQVVVRGVCIKHTSEEFLVMIVSVTVIITIVIKWRNL